MNVITMSARAVGSPKQSATQSGTTKTLFVVETDGGELPLRFSCVAFGSCAEKAASLAEGDEVFLTDRMTASAFGRSMTLVVNGMEILNGENDGRQRSETE
jgi:hypothetical protein